MATSSYSQPARDGLDTTHIRRVSDHAAGDPVIVRRSDHGVVVRADDVEQAAVVADALARVGYQVDRPLKLGRRDELTVGGWSHDGLTTRTVRLNTVAAEIERTRADTMATALDLYDVHATTQADPYDATVRRVREVMTDWVADRAGLVVPFSPRVPGRTDSLLLRAAFRAQQHVVVAIDEALLAAGEAVHRYAEYLTHTPPKAAREAAIHDALPRRRAPVRLQDVAKGLISMPTGISPTPTRFGVVSTVKGAEDAWAATMARMDVCYRLGVSPHPGDVADNTRLLDALGATTDDARQALFDRLAPSIVGKTNRIIDAISELTTEPEGQARLDTSPAVLAAADFPAPAAEPSPAADAPDPGPSRTGPIDGMTRNRRPGR